MKKIKNFSLNPLAIGLMILAVIGLVYSIIFEPMAILNTIVLYGLVGVAFYAIYKFIINKQPPYQGSYSQHNAQHGPYAYSNQPHHQKPIPLKKKKTKSSTKRRTDHPFKVIEGNKGKKKRSL